jgi:hypothetical protein
MRLFARFCGYFQCSQPTLIKRFRSAVAETPWRASPAEKQSPIQLSKKAVPHIRMFTLYSGIRKQFLAPVRNFEQENKARRLKKANLCFRGLLFILRLPHFRNVASHAASWNGFRRKPATNFFAVSRARCIVPTGGKRTDQH